ncbi:MAG: phenylacetate-CoA oxygenase subunit PaaC [Anaerolineales bacterium]|nr:phenylacetate-CoA oxygenase subunit PaaC [Anaerolineales bacterium]
MLDHKALARYLIALADDELILGHRNSEWTGHAPILEEDIAFANLALDEIGHSRLWYELAADLLGEDRARFPDRQVFLRPAEEFRNLQLVELPRGDWAFSMLRQYLFDVFEQHRLAGLSESTQASLAEVAARIRTEEIYHLRHTRAWVTRLGLGTEESNRRMQAALDALWPYARGLGGALPGEAGLPAGVVPDSAALYEAWLAEVSAFLAEAGLTIQPGSPDLQSPISRADHSSDFAALIEEMQSVARLDPEATW